MDETISDPAAARRLARTIVGDIALYHKDEVERGIVEDSLFDLLREPLREGREHYEGRVDPALLPLGLFEKALVDVLVRPTGRIKSRIW